MSVFDRLVACALVAGCSVPPESEYVSDASADSTIDAAIDAPADVRVLTCDASYSDHCYDFHDVLSTWAQAESDCQSRGGHLVAIDEVNEQAYVAGIVGANVPNVDAGQDGVWIGLHASGATSADGGAIYAWSDGDVATYTHWASKHPTGDPCVFMYNAKFTFLWDDFVCNVLAWYVCETP